VNTCAGAIAGGALVLLLASCGASSPPPAETSHPATVSVAGCPVPEPGFCQEATALADAILQTNAEAVFTLSRAQRLACADLDEDTFPQCAQESTLRGHVIGSPGGERVVVSADEYRAELAFLVEGINESFEDGLGGGEQRILGVSTCGSTDPRARSYELVVTAGIRDPKTGLAARYLGTYELTERNREWAISVASFAPLSEWETVLDDPMRDIGCGGIEPWG
jgi:hypothetical protein